MPVNDKGGSEVPRAESPLRGAEHQGGTAVVKMRLEPVTRVRECVELSADHVRLRQSTGTQTRLCRVQHHLGGCRRVTHAASFVR